MRTTKGAARNHAKKRLFKKVKGYVGGRRKLLRTAKETLIRAGVYATRDRRVRKRDFRRLWIIRLSAAAKMRGEGALYIMVVEILPNARGPLIVDLCLRTGYTIIQIGVLGFIGLGLQPPTPDWGGMVSQGVAQLSSHPHMALFPAIAISSLVIGFNFLADGMREISLRD